MVKRMEAQLEDPLKRHCNIEMQNMKQMERKNMKKMMVEAGAN